MNAYAKAYVKVRDFFFLTTHRIVFVLSLLMLALPAEAGSLCLFIDASEHRVLALPLTPASELSLSFTHSLYGSIVEEIFTARPGSLESERILYAEQRLAEFYGHESARYENGSWVVFPEHRSFRALDLRVSPGSRMQLTLDSRTIAFEERVEPGAALRVSADLCSTDNDDQ